MFFTLGLYAFISILINKNKKEAISIIKWGFISGLVGMLAYSLYNNANIQNIGELVLMGFITSGGYGMLTFSLFNKLQDALPNKKVKRDK